MRSIRDFYKNKYRGSLFVVKAGGRIIEDDAARHSLMADIKDLTTSGIKILLVYGGGKAIDRGLEAAGIETRKVDGRRITGSREIEIVKHVMTADLGFKVSQEMAALDIHGLCLNGVPAGWMNIVFRERENPDDYGFDGTISEVYADQIHRIFEAINFIVTPCLGISDKNAVNINADNVAVGLATGTKARKLILLSDVDGVIVNGKVAPFLTDKEIPQLIEDGIVTDGMRVKMENCLYAMEHGVKRIHLLDGFRPQALSSEIYDSEGPATMVLREQDRQAYLNEIAAEKAIQTQYDNEEA